MVPALYYYYYYLHLHILGNSRIAQVHNFFLFLMNLSSIGILVKRRSIFLFVCRAFFATVKEPWHQHIISCPWPDLRGSAVPRPCLYDLRAPIWEQHVDEQHECESQKVIGPASAGK